MDLLLQTAAFFLLYNTPELTQRPAPPVKMYYFALC